jgi:hypothetical protein
MAKTINIGRAVNDIPMTLRDRFYCSVGIHTYSGIYCHYDNTKLGHPFDGYYDVCLCGHAKRREGDAMPFPRGLHRATIGPAGFYNPNARKWVWR